MSASIWTPDRVKRLVALWGDGMSASAIARELGNGITRNSVIGRINRLRASGEMGAAVARRGSPIRTAVVEVQALPEVEPEPEVIVPPAPVVTLVPTPRPAPTPSREGVALVDLQPNHCRFPLWNTGERLGLFCGEPKEPGRTSYCSVHRERCEPGRPAAMKIGRAA